MCRLIANYWSSLSILSILAVLHVPFVESLLVEVRGGKAGLMLLLDRHLADDGAVLVDHGLIQVHVGAAPLAASSLAALLAEGELGVLLLGGLHHRRLHLRL